MVIRRRSVSTAFLSLRLTVLKALSEKADHMLIAYRSLRLAISKAVSESMFAAVMSILGMIVSLTRIFVIQSPVMYDSRARCNRIRRQHIQELSMLIEFGSLLQHCG